MIDAWAGRRLYRMCAHMLSLWLMMSGMSPVHCALASASFHCACPVPLVPFPFAMQLGFTNVVHTNEDFFERVKVCLRAFVGTRCGAAHARDAVQWAWERDALVAFIGVTTKKTLGGCHISYTQVQRE